MRDGVLGLMGKELEAATAKTNEMTLGTLHTACDPLSPDTLGARLTDSVGAVGENAEPVSAPPLPPSADRMGYVADLLQELQQMAEREGRSTLAGLLALTVAEARQAAARW